MCDDGPQGEDLGTIMDSSVLTAHWVDPSSESFQVTRVQNPIAKYSNRNGRAVTDCPCKSVFAPNTYVGGSIPAEMIAALEHAQCLWSCALDLPAGSVQLEVNRQSNGPGVLASCGPLIATVGGKMVPCPLAGCSGVDMKMYVDPNAVSYYYGLDARPGSSQYDFVTIALHELGHGFGIIGLVTNSGTGYRSGTGSSVMDFDQRIRYDAGSGSTFPWARNPPSSASTAISAITSGRLYFEGNKFQSAKLYAPTSYSSGSSVYHLDETAYPAGHENSLMTPMLRNGEAIHSIGGFSCDMLETIGYKIPSWDACGSSQASAPTPSRAPAPSPSRAASPSRAPANPPQPSSPTDGFQPKGQHCECTFIY